MRAWDQLPGRMQSRFRALEVRAKLYDHRRTRYRRGLLLVLPSLLLGVVLLGPAMAPPIRRDVGLALAR